MQESGIIEVISFMYISGIWASVCLFDFSHRPHPQLLSNHCERWRHLLDCRHYVLFWESSFTFGGLKSLMTVISLFIDMVGDIPFHNSNC